MTSLRERVRAREPTVGSWVSLSDPAVAEATAETGFDFALVDTEHTTMSLETVGEMARAVDAAAGDTETIVRIPWNDQVRIKRVLDIGVSGVMVPMVESAAEAEEFVAATRYPPDGNRGIAGGRAARYGLDMPEYVTENEPPLTIAQVETEPGLDNVEDIVAVEGLDAVFVGPADLSAALDMFGQWEDERFVEAVETIVDAAHAEGKPAATIATQVEDVEKWVDMGFDVVMAGIDMSHVMTGAARAKAAWEGATE